MSEDSERCGHMWMGRQLEDLTHAELVQVVIILGKQLEGELKHRMDDLQRLVNYL